MASRLNKVLAHAGLCSRRGADRLIEAGRVTVNGEVVRDLGRRVDPARDAIKLDGKRVAATPPPPPIVLALHKPRNVVTTLDDPEGRPTVADYLRGLGRRVYPVGRLDFASEGLVLMTDDGELARDLMHPRRAVPKVYRVKVRGVPDERARGRLERGIELDGRRTLPATVRLLRHETHAWLEITLREGRNRQIRRMLEAVGHPVSRLVRVSIGGIGLGDLGAGRWRELAPGEVARLRDSVGGKGPGRRN